MSKLSDWVAQAIFLHSTPQNISEHVTTFSLIQILKH